MAYVEYTVTTHTGSKVNLRFPYVENPFSITGSYVTTKDLLSYSELPYDADIVTLTRWKKYAIQAGFEHFFCLDEYVTIPPGSTSITVDWKMNNGNIIRIRRKYVSESDGDLLELWFCDSSGKYIEAYNTEYFSWIGLYTKQPGFLYLTWLVCKVGESSENIFDDNEVQLVDYETSDRWQLTGRKFEVPEQPVLPLNFLKGAEPYVPVTDPYEGGGSSEPGGGGGTFTDNGENIVVPRPPIISAADSGFITLFNPSLALLHDLASYMWSDLFDINGWKKIFADPMNAILGLSIVPVNVPASTSKPVKVGNISTDISIPVADSQYVTVDCGTLTLKEFWGGYLDYDPYTKAEIYLPYIGIHPLSVDDIMNKDIHVVYNVDILSGACCAYIECGGTILYSFVGQCASSIPVTGNDWTNVINGAMSIAGAIGSMVATGGASAPMALGAVASTAVNQMKPTVEKSGALGGTGGLLGVQTPYLIVTRPRQAVPKNQNSYTGYPSFVTENLADLSGYTEIESIHLENVPATENELSEIESLLKNGVIF